MQFSISNSDWRNVRYGGAAFVLGMPTIPLMIHLPIIYAEEIGLGFSGIDDGDPREMYHTLKSLLISPEGILLSSYSGDSWLPKEVELNIKNRLKAYGMD